MSRTIGTVQKEMERTGYMLAAYEKRVDRLPKGSVKIKKAVSNLYCYLKYRDGKKAKTDNLG
jgi:hypothetical protein